MDNPEILVNIWYTRQEEDRQNKNTTY